MIQEQMTITNRKGIHARPASLIAKIAMRYDSEVSIECKGQCISAKDVMSILSLQAVCGTDMSIIVDGADEAEAMAELAELICGAGLEFD